MATKTRPLTASLHTVTAVTRTVLLIRRMTAATPGMEGLAARDDADWLRALTKDALNALGYSPDLYADEKGQAVFAACLASVRKAVQS